MPRQNRRVRSLILIGVVACLTAGLMAAQDAPPARHGFGPGGPRDRGPGGGAMSERWLSKNLSLTAEQSNKMHAIFQSAHGTNQGTLDKMSTLHTSLTSTVKNDVEPSIESVTR